MSVDENNRDGDPLAPIVGSDLYAVMFILDYVELYFQRSHSETAPRLDAFVHPTIEKGNRTFHWDTPRYRDVLCECISHTVRTATVEKDVEIAIELDNDTVIAISLRPEDRNGEAAILWSDTLHPQSSACRVW